MATNYLGSNRWEVKHICSKTGVLPKDFFAKSIFGKSVTIHEGESAKRISSDLKVEAFIAAGFPLDICDALEYGLPLLLGGNPLRRAVPNHASAMQHENQEFVSLTLEKWERMGVFTYVTERPYIVNPLSVVTSGQKKRLVLDARASGLNDFIIAPKFMLPNMGDVVQRLHTNDFMIKLDLANGFLQLPIQHSEQTYLGFQSPIDGRFATLQRLPFGLRSAPFLFATFTHALKLGAKQVIGVDSEVYIDDWFLSNSNLTTLVSNFNKFTNFLGHLGVAIQQEKTEGPAQVITYLGLTINTIENHVSLTEVKRTKYLSGIQELLQTPCPTMSQLAKTAGRLVHTSFVHRAGAGHIQPLWDVLYKERKGWTKFQLEHEGLHIDPELQQCLLWWSNALSVSNLQRKAWLTPAKQLFLWTRESVDCMAPYAATVCTDASYEGWGACTRTSTLQQAWSNRQKRTSINWRELKAISLAVEKWDFLRNTPILILTDSSTAVAAIRKRASQTNALQDLVNEIGELELKRNVEIVAVHIPGVLNNLPDQLSRGNPWDVASLWSFNKDSFPKFVIEGSFFCGIQLNKKSTDSRRFNRMHPINVETKKLLFAISTPDIPFIKNQLQQLKNPRNEIFIVVPKLPTTDLPLAHARVVQTNSPIYCLDAPNLEWSLLEITQDGGTPAKIVTNN